MPGTPELTLWAERVVEDSGVFRCGKSVNAKLSAIARMKLEAQAFLCATCALTVWY